MKPTPPDIFAAVAKASREQGFQVFVIGGHAVNAYGYVRTTLDADFLVCADDFDIIRHAFEEFGYRVSGRNEAFAKMEPPSSAPLFLPVDLMLVSRETFRKLEEGCRQLQFGSTWLEAPQPLHLIALKLHAMKNDARRRSGKDLTDILEVIRLCQIDVGGIAFEEILSRYGNAETRAALTEALKGN